MSRPGVLKYLPRYALWSAGCAYIGWNAVATPFGGYAVAALTAGFWLFGTLLVLAWARIDKTEKRLAEVWRERCGYENELREAEAALMRSQGRLN